MRRPWISLIALVLLAALPAAAQETRGTINGTVRDDVGVVPGASVKVINVDTNQTQQLTTNATGYFEASLLQPGNYRVTAELAGFKTVNQTGIVLSVGQTLSLTLKLDVGQLSETVDVTAQAPILDTTSVSSGQNFDSALIAGLPTAANMPILLARFAQGAVSPTTQVQVISGQIDGPTNAAGSPAGGVGNYNYTIDGATNAGSSRRIASSPNADMIQEMRVETSNFDASQGHGTGATIAMMTRAGTNRTRGTINQQYWTNKINSLNPQQKLAFGQRPDTGRIYEQGYSTNTAFTLGGPVVIPRVVNGRDKLFFFANYQRNYDNSPAQSTPTGTVPANEKHLNGDFSDLLALPNGSQYQIYDPLLVRPDPNRANGVLRTPFENNIIPRHRFMNPDGSYKSPLFALYRDMVPPPNQNFIESGQVPMDNYYRGGTPNQVTAQNFGARVDYNHSNSDRFFFRASGTTFYEYNTDWTYETKYAGLHANDKTRASWSYTGNYTKALGATVVDSQLAANRFYEDQQRRGLHKYSPTSVGLPSYLDDFCKAVNNCMLPVINIDGYQGVSNTADGGLDTTNFQAQSNITNVRGNHTVRGGVDFRLAMRRGGLMQAGNVSSTYTFNNTYTRLSDSTAVTSSPIGPSLAALMLGIPTSVSIGTNTAVSMRNPYVGIFAQDTWRASRNLTLNFGLRYEYEAGITEAQDRWITEFDPDAVTSITELAQAAYARNPIPQVPVSEFRVLGGSVYAGAPGATGTTWLGESMWMPRVSGAYKLGERNVVKGGYGLFFDTLNAGDYTGFNQTGYSMTTTNVVSTNFGQTWLLGDPVNGISPLADPFPVRPNGSRYEATLGDSLGVDTILGTNFTRENPNRKHPRVQRWRLGIQREVFRGMAVEVAYSGSYADRIGVSIPQVYVPEQYYSAVTTQRDTSALSFLQQNVPNPFNINNFAALAISNPALYARMQGSAFFTAAQVQRQTLLRGFPHLSGLTFANLPLGVVKSHTLEINVDRRYSNGLSANLAFSASRVLENRTVELYDRAPTLWQPSQDARPYRFTGGAVYELPVGATKPFLNNGGLAAAILGGWQTGATVEYQPGALLEFQNNLFFNGDPKNIAKDKPEIALQRNGNIDTSKTWFNIDAGFERDPGKQPAQFQKRSFPFRIDGLRGTSLFLVNMNVVRNFALGQQRQLQVRMDVQNLFDAVLWQNPQMNPTSTSFGQITGATNSIMRFFTFMAKVTF